MVLNLKTKIWLTVATIVLLFSFFTLYYFPGQQAKLLLRNYNIEVQNLASTVSLGVKIAITEQNFEGVQTAMEFVKSDPRLEFISMLQTDTLWNEVHTSYTITEKLFRTYPEDNPYGPAAATNEDIIVKRSPFESSMMSGAILIGFSTDTINSSVRKIKVLSLLVSGLVFGVGIIIGFWLSKTISDPVLALRNAAIRVGEGDFSARVKNNSGDEIGELGKSFNQMVEYLSITTQKLKKANIKLATTNDTLNNTLQELKVTQDQLIQAEKLASLGELTAGIAHEIQNPLNFVNNFSEVSAELAVEMKEELLVGNTADALALAEDIQLNMGKIVHHGRRADSIVKNMLQHARQPSGQREFINLNALVDEYLRLSYHGLRAKDKNFNAAMETDFDEAVGKVEMLPQEMGRVLLNLFNNAFYSVLEKKKLLGTGYAPTLYVATRKTENGIEIKVKDNGMGIPQQVLAKIYQPFFTTKPTGEGTGLGLSMSYDIVTKGHGGTMKAQTEEGEYAEFDILLPA